MVLVPRLRSRVSPIVTRIASRLPPHPNLYTLLGLLAVAAGSILALKGRVYLGVLLMALGGLLDALDGAVARAHGRVSRAGGFLDSVSDRIADAMITYSFSLFAPMLLVDYLIAATMLYSYARARAEAASCRRMEGVGLLERGERLPLQLAILLVYAALGASVALPALYLYAALLTGALIHRVTSLYALLARMD